MQTEYYICEIEISNRNTKYSFIQWIFARDSCHVSSFVLSIGDILMNKNPSDLRCLDKNCIWSSSGRCSRETKKLKEEEMYGRGLVELLYLII